MNQMSRQMGRDGANARTDEEHAARAARNDGKNDEGQDGADGGRGAPPVRTIYGKGGGSVNGFACKYEGMRGAGKSDRPCAAKPAEIKFSPSDFQVFEKMKEFMAGFQNALSPFGGGGGGVFRDMAEPGFEGFPVQQTIFRNGQPELKTETKSIARANLGEADFSLGSAKKVEMPIPQGKR
jgi:hypothetical protein